MKTVRVALMAVLLLGLATWNSFYAPSLMTDRKPVFNGPDIAQNWEWRSMAVGMHGWWLWNVFPDAKVANVGYVSERPEANVPKVGIQFSNWIDQELGLEVDESQPPLDATHLDIRDELSTHAKNWSRIHCRDDERSDEDSCFFLVTWDWDLLPPEEPELLGVRTAFGDHSEIALVERTFLESIIGGPAESLPSMHEVAPPQ